VPSDDAQRYLRSFALVARLYQHFRSQDLLPAKNHFGRTPPSELDFVIDVENVAKRILTHSDYTEFLRVRLSDQLWLLPKRTRFILGAAWARAGLGTDGDYRSLYRFTTEDSHREREEAEAQWQQLKARISDDVPDETFDVRDIVEEPEPEPIEWLGLVINHRLA
jgi:hypothetical protein